MEASRTSVRGRRADDGPDPESRAQHRSLIDRLADLAVWLLGCRSAQISVGDPGTVRGQAPADRVDLAALEAGATSLAVALSTPDGLVLGSLRVSDDPSRTWTAADKEVLHQLAPAVLAALDAVALGDDLDAERLRWQLAVEASGMGSFDADLVAGTLQWDGGMFALMGVDRETFAGTIADFVARLHPDDRLEVQDAIDAAIAAHGPYAAQARIVRPDGQVRWFQARGRVVLDARGRAVRLAGAVLDITEMRLGEERVARALDTVAVAFLTVDASGLVQYLNVAAERLLVASRSQAVGRPLTDLLPAAALPPFTGAFDQAASHRRPVMFEAPISRAGAAAVTWCEVRVSASPDGLTLTLLDVTAVRAARLRTARMADRTALLARVTAELAETLDVRTAVDRLARLVVPSLAEAALVAAGTDAGEWEDVGSWHRVDSCRASLAGSVPSLLTGLRALDSRRQRVKPDSVLRLSEDEVAGLGAPATVLPPGCSALVLPLRARGRALGIVVLFRRENEGIDHDDAAIAAEIAGRAALTLDNARLYTVQRELAEGLQRRMLTDAPPLPGLATAVRYLPASATAAVGGDWYDVFVQPPGRPVFVIGDVVGHDTAAAALMGQVRALMRGIAHTTGEGPAQVLGRLDAAMEGLRVRTTATAAVVRLEGADEHAEPGVRLRWANAGHPPPMLVSSDCSVRLLTLDRAPGAVPDLLLGVDATSPRHEQVVPLLPGATLLLYTDGLVERRDLPVQQGIERLADHLADLAHAPLEELCDALLDRLLPPSREDDVALLAVRLAP